MILRPDPAPIDRRAYRRLKEDQRRAKRARLQAKQRAKRARQQAKLVSGRIWANMVTSGVTIANQNRIVTLTEEPTCLPETHVEHGLPSVGLARE